MHTVDIETVMAADIVVNRQSECGVIEAPPSELIKIEGITSLKIPLSKVVRQKSLKFHDLFSQLYPSSRKCSGPPTRSPPECRSKCRKMRIAHIWRGLQFQEAFRHTSRYVTAHIKITPNDLDFGHSKIQIW